MLKQHYSVLRQTQSNFEFTWSLIEHLNVTVSVDFTEVLTTLSAGFEHTWSLIEECWRKHNHLLKHVVSTPKVTLNIPGHSLTMLKQHSLSAVHKHKVTLNLPGHSLRTFKSRLPLTSLKCLLPCVHAVSKHKATLNLPGHSLRTLKHTLSRCCEQTQSNFEHTWSFINNVEQTLNSVL